MLKIYDRFNKRYFFANHQDINIGSRIKTNKNSYVIIYIRRSTNEPIEIDVIPEDEHIKQNTLVNLSFDYITLGEVEEILKEKYGFILKMIKE